MNECCDKYIPKITIKNGFQPPWFDSEVYDKCREKERIRIQLKNCKAQAGESNDDPTSSIPTEQIALEIKFKNARRQVNRIIRTKMRANFSDNQSEKAISKKFWSHVKATSNSHRIPETVHHNSIHRSLPSEQADLFNKYFYEQFSSASKYDVNINYSLNFDIDFVEQDIYGYLKRTDPNKAPGPDNVHGKVLKNCAKSLARPLAILFKTSYYTCKIPTDWKSANVVPVFKKGCKNSVCNYRPISLTSLVMKVYEQAIRSELFPKVLDKIDKRQHGFLPKKSCETQLIPFYEMLANSLNSGSRTDVIYFDFAKAFDSVNHDIILNKLKLQYGIDGLLLKFFVEYLSNRFQRVVINGNFSSKLSVQSGVPQGSILGPILFVLFINDIAADIDSSSGICLYADDTKLFREVKSFEDQLKLQKDINSLTAWATLNKMKFHPDKCKFLCVSLNRTHDQPAPYTINGVQICQVNSEKDLGVHITSRLNWTEHCNYLYSRANRNLGLLKRTCSFIKNRAQRRSLYLAMVRSQLEHCSTVWSPSSATSIEKLESLQKRAIKWVFDEQYSSYSPELYYIRCKELNLLPIKYKLMLKDLKLFHDILNSRVPIDLPQYYCFFRVGAYSLRSSHMDDLSIVSSIQPRVTRNYNANSEVVSSSLIQFTNSYFYRTMNAWNSMPYDARSQKFPKQFECAAINWLWQTARPTNE